MDTADSQHLSRISKMLLAGTGVAFAWVLLSLAVGFTGDQARADEDPGLLGAVTSTVEDTASAGTEVVGGTVEVVAETVQPVAQTVAPVAETVAPVAEAVAPVVETVTSSPAVAPVVETVQTVAAPVVTAAAPVVDTVGGLAEGGVVAPIVDTALHVVDGVPVVGGVVSGLGVDKAASSVGSTVDGVLGGTAGPVVGVVTDVVDTAAGPVVGVVTEVVDTATGSAPGSVVPGLPSLTEIDPLLPFGSTSTVAPSALPPTGVQGLELFLRSLYATGALTAHTFASDAVATPLSGDAASVVFGAATGGMLNLVRSALQADSGLAGPGGAGPGAWVLVALGFVVAYRAWVRRSGPENDVAPPAPAFGTDVSPD